MEHHNRKHQEVSRETFKNVDQIIENHRSALEEYLDQLLWWNERINLVSRDVSRETVWEHIRHSLILSDLDLFKNASIIVDTGSGGGLPGIPLAITHPQKHFVLNDIVSKKCLAMKQIAKKIGLKNIGIVDGSIKDVTYNDPFLLISKHAFKVDKLYKMTATLPWKAMVFYKGLIFKDELEKIPESLKIESYDLSLGSEFYQGKNIVVLQRK